MRRKNTFLLAILILILLSPSSTVALPAVEFSPAYKAGEVLVRVDASAARAASIDAAALFARHGARAVRTLYASDVQVLRVPPGHEAAVAAALSAEPAVIYAEPNYRYAAFDAPRVTPNDPHFGKQWAHTRLQSAAAWEATTGSADITIAVIDSGVDLGHPDLAGKLVAGYDFVSNDATPNDTNGHGTHVAGIAAAAGNNGIGVAGVAWAARIMPVRVLDANGSGYNSDITEGINWAANHGADVINLSLGGTSYSYSMQDAINGAHAAGILVVAAMGNCRTHSSGCPGTNPTMYPAAYANVFAVAATGPSDAYAYYSQYGAHCDVAAPGGAMYYYQDPNGVYSTMPTYDVTLTNGGFNKNYDYLQGTSQAAPHVAGLAALLWALDASLTPDAIQAAIEETSEDLGPTGWDSSYGHGRINAQAAVMQVAKPAAPVIEPIANPEGDGAYTVQWNAVALATRYTLEEDIAPNFPAPTTLYDGAATQFAVSGRAAGRWYYRVQAHTDFDTHSPWSAWEAAGVLPDAPALDPIDNAANADAYTLRWSDVLSARSYTLEQDDDPAFGSPATRYAGAATVYTVTGQPGGTWHYRVRAHNVAGSGAWSITRTSVVSPSLLPAPVLSPTLNLDGDGAYTLDWRSVTSATHYTLEQGRTPYFSAPQAIYTGTALAHAIAAQPTGVWHYRVRAHSASASSPWSNAETVGVTGKTYLPLVVRE